MFYALLPSMCGIIIFCMQISVHTEEIAVDGSEDRKARMYTISINPCVKFQNQLPVPLTYILEVSQKCKVSLFSRVKFSDSKVQKSKYTNQDDCHDP